jgi:hypothetical protein
MNNVRSRTASRGYSRTQERAGGVSVVHPAPGCVGEQSGPRGTGADWTQRKLTPRRVQCPPPNFSDYEAPGD